MVKDICIMEKYTDREGNEKASWNKIGILFTAKNGKEYIKLHHIPGTLISIFEKKKKEESPAQAAEPLQGVDLS